MIEPRQFKHDCQRCCFLGRYEFDGLKYDLYSCYGFGGRLEVIARYGDKGWEYASGIEFADQPGPLMEALRRHKERLPPMIGEGI